MPHRAISLNDHREDFYWTRVREHGRRYRNFDWPSVELIFNLVYTYDLLERRIAVRLGKHGLSLSAFNILMILSRSDNGKLNQREIGRLLLVSRADVTGLVAGLVKRGLVERTKDKNDRRVCMVRIAKKGQELVETLLPGHYDFIRELFSGLDNRDKRDLCGLLGKLRKCLSETAPQSQGHPS